MKDMQLGKQAVAKATVALIEDGMLIGLGSGSTAAYFINFLAQRCQEGLKIRAIATSAQSEALALRGRIPLISQNEVSCLDLTVDGADEIDPEKRMIKGGGGALFREKIAASISHEMIVMVDESKLVKALGKFPLPVEISSFAHKAIIKKLHDLGYDGTLRKTAEGNLFITDGGNLIYDIQLKELCSDPEALNNQICEIPGVIVTGLFFKLAGRVFVGNADGSVKSY